MYLATGEFNSADGDHNSLLDICDDTIEVDGDSYLYFYLDMKGDFAPWDAEGRVNMIRMDLNNVDYTTPGLNRFDVCFVGCFRTVDDAENYVYDYLGVEKPEKTTKEEKTTVGEETTVAGGDQTTATAGGEQTTVAGGSDDNNNTADDNNGGCGSVIGFGTIAVVATVGAIGFVSLKKKKED